MQDIRVSGMHRLRRSGPTLAGHRMETRTPTSLGGAHIPTIEGQHPALRPRRREHGRRALDPRLALARQPGRPLSTQGGSPREPLLAQHQGTLRSISSLQAPYAVRNWHT